jgi:hypothetical protein
VRVVDKSVAAAAKPSDLKRFRVIRVMGMRFNGSTFLARATLQKALFESMVDLVVDSFSRLVLVVLFWVKSGISAISAVDCNPVFSIPSTFIRSFFVSISSIVKGLSFQNRITMSEIVGAVFSTFTGGHNEQLYILQRRRSSWSGS